MSTLIARSRGSGCVSTKLICGIHPAGKQTIAPYPPLHKHPSQPLAKDTMEHLTSGGSLRRATAALTRPHVLPTLWGQSAAMSWKGVTVPSGMCVVPKRLLHSDVEFPNFDGYRVESTKEPHVRNEDTIDHRRMIHYGLVYGVGGMLTIFAGREVVRDIVYYKWMAADQRALASTEIDLTQVPLGKTKTYQWRGKPVFVRHRTPEEVAHLRAVDTSSLRDAERDEDRVKKDEWSIVIGVCTHLGCIPFADKGDYQGYFCPCHGSHYDGSGRIRKGPAPRNLEVPEYTFINDDTVVVGMS